MLWLTTFLTGTSTRKLTHALGRRPHRAIRTDGGSRRVARRVASFFAAVQDYRVRRAAIRELNRLDNKMLADIGISHGDIHTIARQMTERRRAALNRGEANDNARRSGKQGEVLGDACCTGL